MPKGARPLRHFHLVYAHTRTYLAHMRWPQWLAMALFLGSAVLWIFIWRMDALAMELAAETEALYRNSTATTPAITSEENPIWLAPPEEQFFNDLKSVFNTAKKSGVGVGKVDYKREANATTGIVSRRVDLHVTDNYPRMKEFIAKVLAEMPHAVLHELRIERNDPLSPQALMLVRFSLTYQADATTAKVAP